jgi:uncharacterized DUF497 family protein
VDILAAGFEWDAGNREKCQKHGVPLAEIEALFGQPLSIRRDDIHSATEPRYIAVGRNGTGRWIFLVFTYRRRGGRTYIRPIGARYMHRKEIMHYEKENPEL